MTIATAPTANGSAAGTTPDFGVPFIADLRSPDVLSAHLGFPVEPVRIRIKPGRARSSPGGGPGSTASAGGGGPR
ncbi:hypothetical protein IOD13_14080 [Brevibacterium casei]|nr:hypothetical protein [Brevibacterium casei]